MKPFNKEVNAESIDIFIGHQLRELRKSRNMTQEEVAIKLGFLTKSKKPLSYHTIINYEKGKSQFTVKFLLQLSKLFGVDITYFIRNKDMLIFDSPENPEIIVEVDKKDRVKFIKLLNSLKKLNNTDVIDHFINLINEFTKLVLKKK